MTTTIRVTTSASDIRPAILHQLRMNGYRGEVRIIACETLGPVGLYAYAYRATVELLEA